MHARATPLAKLQWLVTWVGRMYELAGWPSWMTNCTAAMDRNSVTTMPAQRGTAGHSRLSVRQAAWLFKLGALEAAV